VFFLQERLGLGKRKFKIYKFRTMVTNAEELIGNLEHLNQSQGPTFKLRNDPRITRLGAFLRKTSLDELPQFINVLLGHMSLVGPRPLPLRDYRGFSEDWHRRRFSVKPGMTCLWQVMGRSSVSFDRWMELDMSYIDTWSIWLDFKILFQTITVVLRGSGAF
jgi:lipopolysaccharide/colanic/teichoic acid biosynthesis glycosyltransferase